MWQVLHVIVYALLWFHMASGHKSFRIASLTRGFDVYNNESKVLGGTSHECYRTCVEGDIRTCHYSLTLVAYTTMSRLCGDCPYTLADCYNTGCITAGGDVRQVTVANHALPGPSMEVCEGDIVKVDVINTLASDSSTIHWHGIHQVGTPYMDGTPYLTQCPIHPHNSFQYKFEAYPTGSHIWHSHSGFQEADGLYGAFIVRQANDPLSVYYDYDLSEHIMAVWHWYGSSTASVLKRALHRVIRTEGYALIINGLAAIAEFEKDGEIYTTPRAEFTVSKDSRYRFRLMHNSAVYCPIQVSVDNHTLLVIASEDGTFEPVQVDSLIINAGERYDFVLTADQEVDNYWIRYRGIGNCAFAGNEISGEAILRYVGADTSVNPPGSIEYDDAYRSGVLLNPVQTSNFTYDDNTLVYLVDLNNTLPNQPDISGTPDHTIYMQYKYNTYEEFHSPGPFVQFNNLSFEFPPIPLLTQFDEITSDMFCTETDYSAQDCIGNYCNCPLVYPVNHNSLVELVIVDEATDRFLDHPMHLHGHSFHIVAMEAIGSSVSVDDVKIRNENGLIDKKLQGAPVKDTVGVPAQGFIVLRFIADNPGYWFFHCHVSNHAELGMGVVIKVGEHDEMIQPPDTFPTCGNWDVEKASKPGSGASSIADHRIFVIYLMAVASYLIRQI